MEIHLQGRKDGKALEQTWLHNVKESFLECMRPGEKLRLVFWPKLLERLIIAGTTAEMQSGDLQRAPRWCVHMGHVALPKDPDEETEWTLLGADRVNHWFSRYCCDGVDGFVDVITVRR